MRSACRYLLAAVFLMAALSKITDLWKFEVQMLDNSGLPSVVAKTVTVILPWLELTCGGCFLFNRAVREAGVLSGVLLIAFTVYAILYRNQGDCGCFVVPIVLPKGLAWQIARNGILLLCAGIIVIPARRPVGR